MKILLVQAGEMKKGGEEESYSDSVQQLADNVKQIKKDLREYNKLEESVRHWRERRLKIIKLLNETADHLSILHSGTKTADMMGTVVCVAGGILVFSGGVGLAVIGSAQMVGSAVSFGAQYYEEDKTRQRLEELQYQLKQDGEDLVEIDKLLRTIGDTMKRLNQFTKSLHKLIKAGKNTMGKEFFESGTLKPIDELLNDDGFMTFMNEDTKHSNTEQVPISARPDDWSMHIFLLKMSNGVSLMNAAGKNKGALLEKEGGNFVPGVNNMLALALDVYHLVEISLETREPKYIQELRDTANALQKQVYL